MKIVLACPNWVGDAVMATPAIRSLREQFPQALITLVASTKVQQVLMPNPWTARCIDFGRGGLLAAAKALRREGYDAGVLLPNSFRAALLFRLGRVRRRIGYRRDFRAALLTDGLRPEKRGRQFLPVPQIDYYLSLVAVLGAAGGDRRMELFTDPADEKVADDAFARLGLSGERTLVLAPGASFGPSKLWPPERMAALADAAARRWGLQ
ncbi:MAG: glycosyltransferase family 9 protein, partial [Planctomycetia bacterium]|nr:glycosyltransferase family 9 protein [Planctomycetia bacterium]